MLLAFLQPGLLPPSISRQSQSFQAEEETKEVSDLHLASTLSAIHTSISARYLNISSREPGTDIARQGAASLSLCYLDGFNRVFHLEKTPFGAECVNSSVILTTRQKHFSICRKLMSTISNCLAGIQACSLREYVVEV
jgi:hypothetical protein